MDKATDAAAESRAGFGAKGECIYLSKVSQICSDSLTSASPICRKSDQPTEGYDFHNHMMPYGPLGLHRPILLEILQSKLSSDCKIHTSKRLERYETSEKGSINLVFSDGSTVSADILYGPPTFSGTIAYGGGLQKAKFAERFPNHRALDHPKAWCGKNMHVVSHPVGPSIGIICYYSDPDTEGKPYEGALVADVAKEDVTKRFENWNRTCYRCSSVEVYNAWAVHVVKPLPCYVSGPVVLIGDAAHAMTPHQGVGGGQAIEDAHILGRLLAHSLTKTENIPAVLKLYEELRLTLTQEMVEKSRVNGMMYEFNHPLTAIAAQ
ncbi:hypothetical protein DFH06DRAFT_1338914 [Mycena polygramma]|nr:hypothetical protein DFH06DRAFT_1338914 [Mycena polygramma]